MNNIMNKEAFDRCITTARLLGVKLSPEDLNKLSGLATLSEMNGLLISIKQEARPVLQSLTEEQRGILRGHTSTSAKIRQLTKDILHYDSTLLGLINSQNEYINKIHKAKEEIEYLELLAKDSPLVSSIEKVIRDGVFSLISITNTEVTFLTPDVTCSWRDDRLGISLDARCGKYKVMLSLPSLSVKISKVEEVDCRYPHPHVSSDFSPCWGNASVSISKARIEQDISKILSLCYGLLTTYNPDSPYIKLIDFDKKVNPGKYDEAMYIKSGKLAHIDDVGANDNYIMTYVLAEDSIKFERGKKIYVHEIYHLTLNGARIDNIDYILCEDSYKDLENLGISYEIRGE